MKNCPSKVRPNMSGRRNIMKTDSPHQKKDGQIASGFALDRAKKVNVFFNGSRAQPKSLKLPEIGKVGV